MQKACAQKKHRCEEGSRFCLCSIKEALRRGHGEVCPQPMLLSTEGMCVRNEE